MYKKINSCVRAVLASTCPSDIWIGFGRWLLVSIQVGRIGRGGDGAVAFPISTGHAAAETDSRPTSNGNCQRPFNQYCVAALPQT